MEYWVKSLEEMSAVIVVVVERKDIPGSTDRVVGRVCMSPQGTMVYQRWASRHQSFEGYHYKI